MIPIFPELRPYLEEVVNQMKSGQRYLINRYRDKNANLRTQLLRIIEKAGVQPWPKQFQNPRSTRETVLAEKYPLHVVRVWIADSNPGHFAAAWLGHSSTVANKHYRQVTDEHFELASKSAAPGAAKGLNTDEKPAKRSMIAPKL